MGLGVTGGRWFSFNAGLGLDAEVVRRVERRRKAGRRASPALYVRTAVRQFYLATDRRTPPLRLEIPGQDPVEDLFLLIVANTRPWTYLGARPAITCPDASFDAGLDVFALRRLTTQATLRAVARALSRGRHRGRTVFTGHDLETFVVRCSRPVALQADGEYLGRVTEASFRSVAAALRVLAPPVD